MSPTSFNHLATSREHLAAIAAEHGVRSVEYEMCQRQMAAKFVESLTLLIRRWKEIRLMGSATGTVETELSRNFRIVKARYLRGRLAWRWRLLPTFFLQQSLTALRLAPWLLPRIVARAVMPGAVQMTLWVVGNQRRQLSISEWAYTDSAGRHVPPVVIDMHTGFISVGGLVDCFR